MCDRLASRYPYYFPNNQKYHFLKRVRDANCNCEIYTAFLKPSLNLQNQIKFKLRCNVKAHWTLISPKPVPTYPPSNTFYSYRMNSWLCVHTTLHFSIPMPWFALQAVPLPCLHRPECYIPLKAASHRVWPLPAERNFSLLWNSKVYNPNLSHGNSFFYLVLLFHLSWDSKLRVGRVLST